MVGGDVIILNKTVWKFHFEKVVFQSRFASHAIITGRTFQRKQQAEKLRGS